MVEWALVLIVLQSGGPDNGLMRKYTYTPDRDKTECTESAIKMLRYGFRFYPGQSAIAAWCEETWGHMKPD